MLGEDSFWSEDFMSHYTNTTVPTPHWGPNNVFALYSLGQHLVPPPYPLISWTVEIILIDPFQHLWQQLLCANWSTTSSCFDSFNKK